MISRFVTSAALAATLGVLLGAAPARAQAVRNGNVASGVVSSASGLDGDTLVAVPAGKTYVVTQFCSEDLRSMELEGGVLLVPNRLEVQSCQTYVPGVAFTGPVDVKCVHTGNFGFGQHCLVTGVMTVSK